MATIFRFYNPTTTNHHYTTDKNEVAALRLSDDWNYEGAKWKTNDGDINVYRFFNKVIKLSRLAKLVEALSLLYNYLLLFEPNRCGKQKA